MDNISSNKQEKEWQKAVIQGIVHLLENWAWEKKWTRVNLKRDDNA